MIRYLCIILDGDLSENCKYALHVSLVLVLLNCDTRFCKDNKDRINSYIFLSFENDPRQCIGIRYALINIKLATVKTLQNFSLKLCEETQVGQKIFFLAYILLFIKIFINSGLLYNTSYL